MKITREGRSLIKITALAGAEEQPEGTPPPVDCCDPDSDGFPDRGGDGSAVSLSSQVAAIVQSAYAREQNNSSVVVTLPAPAQAGNTLILWHVVRETKYATGPSGWTAHPNGVAWTTTSDHFSGAFFYKVAVGGEQAITCPISAGERHLAFIMEVSGLGALDASSEINNQNGASVSMSVTPTGANDVFIVGGVDIRAEDHITASVTPTGSTSEAFDNEVGTTNPYAPLSWVGYRSVDAPSGAYTITGTCSSTSRDWGGQMLAFVKGTPAWVVPQPNATDGDDSTYAAVTGTALLRLDLGAAHRIVRTRIRIASNTSGARVLTIKGANAVDFSDEVTLGTIAYTATGSYTAQDLEATWANSTAYRYYELSSGTSDTYRIHAWELYEGNLATDVAAHLSDSSDAHDASAVSVLDSGGYTATTDVEAALAELYSGLMRVISPTQLAANTDNWNPTGLSTANVIRASTDASRNLTGIVAPSIVKAIVLENVGGFDLVLKHDVTSTAANRFYCPNDTDVTLQKDSAVTLVYDTTSSRWRVVGGAGGGGGSYTDPLTTRGDLVRRGASATERVALGPSGYVLTSDGTDAVWAANAGTFIATRGVVATRTSTQAISADPTYIAFNATDIFDPDGWHDPSSNNTRFTCPTGKGGRVFAFSLVTEFDHAGSGGTATFRLRARKNGSTLIAQSEVFPAGTYTATYNFQAYLDDGDYIEVGFSGAGTASNLIVTDVNTYLYIDGDGGALGTGIGAHAYRTTTQSIATATGTAIGYDAEVFDTHGFHDNSTNNSRMTIPTGMGGLYLVGQSFLNNDGAASWEAFFRVNGSTLVRGGGWIGQSGSATSITSHVVPVVLQAGDYVEAMAYQGSGSSKLLGYGSDGYDARAQFWIIRIDSGSSGMGSGSVEKSYAVFDDSASAENPTPVSSTDVPDLSSITFTITGTRDIVIRYNAGMTKGSDADKVRFVCNIDGSSYGQQWYSQSVGESSIQQVSALWVKKSLAAGTHTIKIQHNAAIGTSSTTFDDQNLVVEVLIP